VCFWRRKVGLGDDVEQPYLQRVAGRLKGPFALVGEPEALAAAVVAVRHALDQSRVAQAANQLRDRGARHARPARKLGAPDVLLGDRP